VWSPAASELSGNLQGWDFSSSRPNLSAPWARITVRPDRLEINSPVFSRARVYPRDQVLLVRLLSLQHPVHKFIMKVHPIAHGRHYVNIVIAHEPGRAYAGNIHYVLAVRNFSAPALLDLFRYYGYPVSRDPKIVKSYALYADLTLDKLRD
jgi:hypothetical protein